MKKQLKMKKYRSGNMVDDDDPEAQKVFRSDLTEYSDEERMPRGAKSVARKAAQTSAARASAMESRGGDDREISRLPSRSPSMSESPENAITGAAFDRRKLTGAGSYSKLDEDARSGAKGRDMTDRESKAASAAGLAAIMIPAGRVAKGAYEVGKAAKRIRDVSRARQDMFGSDKAARKYAEAGGMKKGGSVGSASRRADGIASRGKTKGRMI
jgi:hypothetical protein